MSKESSPFIQKEEQPLLKCLRCDHEWFPRGASYIIYLISEGTKGDRPSICPNCKSSLWWKTRKEV